MDSIVLEIDCSALVLRFRSLRYSVVGHLKSDLDVLDVFLTSAVIYRYEDADLIANEVLFLLVEDPGDAFSLLEAKEPSNLA